MGEYTDELKQHLDKKRDWTKKVFKLTGSFYRAIKKEKITIEQALDILK